MRWLFILAAVAALLIGVWFLLSTYTTRSVGGTIVLVADSLDSRQLIRAEESRNAAYLQTLRDVGYPAIESPERYFPDHARFLAAITSAPHAEIPPRSYAREMERSTALCARPMETAVYIKIRLIMGPMAGSQGWVCESNITPLLPLN